MVFELIPFYTALIFSSIAAIYDLKTTEVPNEIFYVMYGIGIIFFLYQALTLQNIWIIFNPLIVSSLLFSFGYINYRLGQWGGADVFLLSSIGFLVPEIPQGFSSPSIFPFPLTFLINVYLVGGVYLIFYTFVIFFKDRDVSLKFFADLKAASKILIFSSILLFIILILLSFYLRSLFSSYITSEEIIKNSLIIVIATNIFYTIFKLAKKVEDVAFKKRIPISRLKVGDVLMERKEFEGIDEKELIKIKRSGKKWIWIKEGARFAPAFPLALLFSVFYGDGIQFLINFILAY